MRGMRTGPIFYGLLLAAGLITFVVHEGAHWAMAQGLGYEGFFSLNRAGARGTVTPEHRLLITAAGPAATLLQGAIAWALVQARGSRLAWAFLFQAAFMRLMATVISLWNPNDEARIGAELGLGTWTLPLLVTLGLFLLLALGSRRLRVGWATLGLSWLAASAGVTAIVFSGL